MSAGADSLVAQLEHVLQKPEEYKSQREKIISLARKASNALEDPFEGFQRLVYSPLPLVSVRIGQDHGIFSTLVSASEPVVLKDLAAATKVKSDVLEILLGYMAAVSLVKVSSDGRYEPTNLTKMLQMPLFIDGVTHFHDNCLPAFQALNEYLRDRKGPPAFRIGQKSDMDFYTWLESHPIQSGAFHRFMEAQFASLPSWLTVIPFDTEIAKSCTSNEPLFIDVGGGNGQQCVALCEKYPSLHGRIVLQDRPKVLANAITSDRVERMSYDYLTEQPVKGARTYYFRQIFHNNDDETCTKILQAHLPAMSDASILLIDDKVLPSADPLRAGSGEYAAGLNIAMLTMFKALERREDQWRTLLHGAGYEVRQMRKYTDFGDTITIAVPHKQ